jgi:hypothetical protein
VILRIQYAIVKRRNADVSEKSGVVKTDAWHGFTVLTGDSATMADPMYT